MSFEIVDKGKGFKGLAADAGGFKKMMEANVQEAKRLHSGLVNLASAATIIRGVTDGMNKLQDSMASLERIQRENIMTSQLLGNPEGISKLRNEVRTLCEYFGKDYADTIRGVNSLSKGFGISGAKAVSLMRDAMVSGADVNGDFIDTIREYPRYFKEAGISAEAFVAIATNAAKQGVFSDKGVDTIKEANLRLREMTKSTADALNAIGISSESVQQALKNGSMTTFEVMQQVAGKLKELPDSASEVGTAIADIFGGPGEDAGLEYIRSLADVQLSMSAVKEASGDLAKQQENQINTQIRLSGVFSEMTDKIAEATASSWGFVKAHWSMASTIIATTANIGVICTSVKELFGFQWLLILRTKALTLVKASWAAVSTTVNAIVQVMSANMRGAAVSATTLSVAIRGVMVATGAGIALVALNAIIDAFSSSAAEAKENVDGLTEAERSQERQAKLIAEAESKATEAAEKRQNAIIAQKDAIKNFKGTQEEEKRLITELNTTYGDVMGKHETLASWYDTLTSKSKDYCAQIKKQNKEELLNAQIEALRAKQKAILYDENGNVRHYDTSRTKTAIYGAASNNPLSYAPTGTSNRQIVGFRTNKDSALDKAQAEYDQLQGDLEALMRQLDDMKSEQSIENSVANLGGSKGGKSDNNKPFIAMALDKPLGDLTNKQLDEYLSNLRTQLDLATNDAARRKINEAIGRTQRFSDYRQQVIAGYRPTAGAKFAPIPDIKASDTQLDTTLSSQLEQLPHELEPIEVEVKFNAQDAWNNIKSISSAMESLKSVTDESKSGWEKFTTVIDAGFQLWQAMVPLYETINALMKVNNALKTTETGVTATGTAVTAADTNAKIGNAAAGFMAAHAWMPLVGIGLAGAAIGAMVATMFSLPKFAKGGIAYGPTLGLFGEYAGASHNPEVVAPLDKLKSLIGDTGMGGDVYFHINGDALEGVLTKRQRKRARG